MRNLSPPVISSRSAIRSNARASSLFITWPAKGRNGAVVARDGPLTARCCRLRACRLTRATGDAMCLTAN